MKTIRIFLVHQLWGIYRPKIFGRRVSFLRAGPINSLALLLAGIFGATGFKGISLFFLFIFIILIFISFGVWHIWPAKWEELTTRQKYDCPMASLPKDKRLEWIAIQNQHPEWE